MEPIVNGLEMEYEDTIIFEQVDANSPSGRAAMNQYEVRGHPSYVILDQMGNMVWQYTGQTDSAFLSNQLQTSLK